MRRYSCLPQFYFHLSFLQLTMLILLILLLFESNSSLCEHTIHPYLLGSGLRPQVTPDDISDLPFTNLISAHMPYSTCYLLCYYDAVPSAQTGEWYTVYHLCIKTVTVGDLGVPEFQAPTQGTRQPQFPC